MGKGNQKQSTTTKAEPWAPLKPYLTGAFSDAQSVYNKGAPDYYPGQTVAGLTQPSAAQSLPPGT